MNSARIKIIFATMLAICALLLAAGITMYAIIAKDAESVSKEKANAAISSEEDVFVLKQSLQRLDQQIKQVEGYFINHNNAVGFIERIEEIATLSGITVNIENIDVIEKTRSKKVQEGDEVKTIDARAYGEMQMNVQVGGTWQGIMTFLATVEHLNKKIIVNSLRLSASVDEDSGETLWTATFQLFGLTT